MIGTVRVRTCAAQAAGDLVAVEARQADVEEHEVGRVLADGQQRGLAVADGLGPIPLALEKALQQGPVGGIVLDDEHERPIVGRPRAGKRVAIRHQAFPGSAADGSAGVADSAASVAGPAATVRTPGSSVTLIERQPALADREGDGVASGSARPACAGCSTGGS